VCVCVSVRVICERLCYVSNWQLNGVTNLQNYYGFIFVHLLPRDGGEEVETVHSISKLLGFRDISSQFMPTFYAI